MFRTRQFVLGLLTCLLVLANCSLAQTSTTSLQGTVTDPSGAAVANAAVELVNVDSKTQRDAVTDSQGEYRFQFLPPGTYTLTVSAAGFARFEQKGLQLLVNTPAAGNIQLRLGQSTQVVEVSEATPALNTVDASIGDTFNEAHVKQIPIEGRNVPDLLSLQPGVAYTGNRPDADKDNDTRGGAVNGSRSDQSNVTLDGVDVNDYNSAYAFTSVLPVTLDSVQEFRVTTSNYNADQGQGSGAEVAMVTKSGSNNLHGTAYEYMRNTITSANDYLLKASELNAGLPNKPDKLIRNIFGASLGGPIQKNRLFYFMNYEGTRQREQETVERIIPTPTLCQGHIRYVNQANTITDLAPSDIQNLDPNGVGINPAIENAAGTGYFDKTFCTGKTVTNDPSATNSLNYQGFRFGAPVSKDENAVIARLDYSLTSNGKQNLFLRGALQNLSSLRPPFLPGNAPETTILDHSKGLAVGYTVLLTNTIANTFHYGLTRQSTAFIGNSDNKPWNQFLGLDQGITYSHALQMPIHNLTDDLSWTKGSHTLQFGGNIGIARDPRISYQHSWPTAFGTTSWMAPTGFANTGGGSTLDPANKGYPEPAESIHYDYPMLSLLGMVSQMVGNYNYDRSGTQLKPGAPVKRNYGLNWYGMYAQDSWRIKPNLTLTYGLRYELLPPPWEVNGFQAGPKINLGKLFDQNVINAKNGIGFVSTGQIDFGLDGKANNGPGFYGFEKTDFAPRVSLAYTPRFENSLLKSVFGTGDKTVVRAGFAKVFDRPGMQLINTFDQNAPAGLAATLQNPCCIPIQDGAENVPRISNINAIPTTDLLGLYDPFLPAAPTNPFSPPPLGNAITWGIDQSLKTPYAYTIDASIGRELPRGFSLQVAYVGRVARHLLTQRDLMQPLDLVDTKTGIDYFAAAARMSQLGRQGVPINQINDAMVGKTAAYWHDMLPPLAQGAQYYPFASFTTPDLMQAVYFLYTTTDTYPGNEVVGLGNIDLYYGLGDTLGNYYDFGNTTASPNPNVGDMLNEELTSMYAWSSVGNSNYNAMQASLRKQFGQSFEFDFNYTYSKSIDITSAAARVSYNGGINGSQLVNAFAPNQARAVSDFDTTHQMNANWRVDLPFGKGQKFANQASGALDAIIGGWQIWGLARWTSGFPFSVGNGQSWATDWNYSGLATLTAKPRTGAFSQPGGFVSVFQDPVAASNDYSNTFPGQSGSRNVLRGPGYASWDMSLTKRWKLPWEGHSLQFRGEVFNVANLHRFNAQSVSNPYTYQQIGPTFGAFTSLLTQPRVMQFALRYEF